MRHGKKPRELGSEKGKKGGFHIGTAKRGSGVYLGKAEKIKKTLIHKAKLKKQRAKELAKAGYDPGQPSSLRAKGRGGAGAEAGERGGDVSMDEDELMGSTEEDGRQPSVAEDAEMSTNGDGDGADPGPAPRPTKRRVSGLGPRKDGMPVEDLSPKPPRSTKRKSLASRSSSPEPGPSGSALPARSSRRGELPQPPPKKQRTSKGAENGPSPRQHDTRAARGRQQSREAWRRGSGRNPNGQPKLGRKVQGMLSKIQKSMGL